MIRSPQKLNTQPGKPPAWRCEIRGRQETIHVPNEAEVDYLIKAPAEQQQQLLEQIFDRQRKIPQGKQPTTTSSFTPNATANVTPNAAPRTPLIKPTPLNQMPVPNITPMHSSTPSDAVTRHSEVISPVSVDPDEGDINERTAEILEDLQANDKEKDSKPKEEELKIDDQETHLKVPMCQDRFHEFERRAKTDLAVPAKKFVKACQTLTTQLNKEIFGGSLSKEFGDKLLREVEETYDRMAEAREYCLEVLTQQDREQNPRYDQYMKEKLEELCVCQRIHLQYFDEQQRLQEHLQNQQQRMDPDFQRQLDYQQTQQPSTSHAQVYQPPSKQPIISRPPPVVVENPMQPKGQPQQQMGPPLAQPQPNRAFQIYKDLSPIPTPTGPSVIHEQTHLKFRLKDELEVIEQFDGSKPRDYLRFRVQWGNLDDKMMHTDMSGLDKYNALRKVLTGKAKRLIDTKYPDQESYQRSRDKLELTYYKPKLHVTEVIHSLAKWDKMTDNYESLFNGYNRLKDSWDDLEHLNLSKGQLKGLLLITANEKNLSDDTWTIWHSIQNDPRYAENSMECLNVDAFLGAIQTAMNNAQRKQNVVGRRPTTDQKPKPKSTLYGSYNAAAVQPARKEIQKQAGSGCVFCSRTTHHRYQLYCPSLKTLQPEEIWQVMKKNGITCQMCLCPGHSTRECEPTRNGVLKKCSIKDDQDNVCGKFHCRFLHRAPKKESIKKEQSTEPKESNSTNQQ